MAKVINEYTVVGRTFTAADIKDRSSNVGAETVSSTSVLVSNITTTNIRNAIGETTNAVGALSISSKVNKWSAFSPKTVTTPAFDLNFTVDSPYPMGDFAGYNNNAATPNLTCSKSSGSTTTIEGCQEAPTSTLVGAAVHLGEFNWTPHYTKGSIVANYVRMKLERADGGQTIIKDIPWSIFYKTSNSQIEMTTNEGFTIPLSSWSNNETHTFTFTAYFVYIDPNTSTVTNILNIDNTTYSFSIKVVIKDIVLPYMQCATPWVEEGYGCPSYQYPQAQYNTSTAYYDSSNPTRLYLYDIKVQYDSGLYSTTGYKIWYKVNNAASWTLGYSGTLNGSNTGVNCSFSLGTLVDCADDVDIIIGYNNILCPDYTP